MNYEKLKERRVLMENIINLINTAGFPVAMCCVLLYYVNKLIDSHRKEVDELTEAINNNTNVINILLERINNENK